MRPCGASWAAFIFLIAPAAAADEAKPKVTARDGASCQERIEGSATTDDINRRCLSLAGPLAAARKDAIVLRMDDGTRKVFTPPPDDGNFGYALLDFYPAVHAFVVGLVSADLSDVTLVDGRTGRSIHYGFLFPHVSPGAKYVLLVGSGESGGIPDDFKIVAFDDPKAKPIWDSKREATTLSSLTISYSRWVGLDRIRFTLGKAETPFFVVRGADGRWHYDLADDPASGPSPAEPTARPE